MAFSMLVLNSGERARNPGVFTFPRGLSARDRENAMRTRRAPGKSFGGD
jgi:hypothetical protein